MNRSALIASAAFFLLARPAWAADAQQAEDGQVREFRPFQTAGEAGEAYEAENQNPYREQGAPDAGSIGMTGTHAQDDARKNLEYLQYNDNLSPELRGLIRQAIDEIGPQKEEQKGKIEYQRPAGYDNLLKYEDANPRRKDPRRTVRPMRRGFAPPVEGAGPQDQSRSGDTLSRNRNLFSAGGGIFRSMQAPSGKGKRPGLFRGFIAPRNGEGTASEAASSRRDSAVAVSGDRVAELAPERGSDPEARSPEASKISAYMDLARIYLQDGSLQKALMNVNRAVALSPDLADAYALRAIIYERLGDDDAKLRDLRRAASLDPERFGKHLQAALSGKKLFDPTSLDSSQLLEAVRSQRDELGAASIPPVFGLLLAALGALILAAVYFWKPLSRRLSGLLSWRTGRLAEPFIRWKELSLVEVSVTRIRGPRSRSGRPAEGTVLADKYTLSNYLGLDGTVEIWKARDGTLDRPALIKRLYAGEPSSDEYYQRLSEAKSTATLHHPNIADVYEILDLPSGLYIVYEYMSGKTVSKILREKGKLPLYQVRDILIPVCRALAHAHKRGVPHGGLSPRRIVVTRQGYILVTDFVLARTTAAGSEPYSSPEAKRGEPVAASDIYSMGVCLFELLTGEKPGQSEKSPDPRVAHILDMTLDLDFRTRLSSANGFMKLLKQLNGEPDEPEEVDGGSGGDGAKGTETGKPAENGTEEEDIQPQSL